MKILNCWVLLIILVATQARGQQNCRLILGGGVREGKTNAPVPFATVRLLELHVGTTTDENGNFKIPNLCSGSFTLEISHLECKHFTEKIYIESNLDLNIQLEHDPKILESVTIAATKMALKPLQISTQLNATDIARGQGKSFADLVASVAGVTVLRTGAGIAKPMLQGMTGDRLPILTAGVRQIGQSWGLDHAPEIDPNAFETIEILSGANSVRYGNGAIGGVILLKPKAFEEEKRGITGGGQLVAQSNGRGGSLNVFFEDTRRPFQWRLQHSARRLGNLEAPDYFLNNSGLSALNASFQGQYRNFNIFYTHFQTKIGILRDAHIGNVTDLLNAIERGNPTGGGRFSYEILRPAQRVSHDFLRIAHRQSLGKNRGHLQTTAAIQYNLRREYDAHRPGGKVDSTDFQKSEIGFEMPSTTLRTEWERRHKNWHRNTGAEWNWQLNNTFSGALLPDFRHHDLAIFDVAHWKPLESAFEFELGARYENRQTKTQATRTNVAQHLKFDGFSGNLGAIWRINNQSKLSFWTSTAFRSPNVSELLSNGVHHGAASFERGNLNLKSERSFNQILNFDYAKNENFELNLKIYVNQIQNYIHLMPDTTWNEALKARGVVVTIRGSFPAFFYRQTDAILGGGDLNMAWRPFGKILTARVKTSVLRGRDRTQQNWLPLLPSDRVSSSLEFDFSEKIKSNFLKNLKISIDNQWIAQQNRVPTRMADDGLARPIDFAPPPPAYALTHLRAHARVGKMDWSIGVENVFNERYRDYLDRLRYFADATGRNFSLSLSCKL